MSAVQELFSILLNGMQLGAIFALLGIGLTIILGTMNFLNLAHGALYLIGAYAGMLVMRVVTLRTGLLQDFGFQELGLGWGFLVALVLVPVVGFVVGVLMERFVAKPFYKRPHTDQLLVTFGLALIVEELVKQVIGGNTFQSQAPETLFGLQTSGSISLPIVGGFPRWRLVIILIAFIVIGLTWLFMEKTDWGLIVKAGTLDSEMVSLLGIRIDRSYALVFGLGAALAAFAGLIGTTFETVRPQIGTQRALVPAFLVLVVGGAGSVRGAIVGGIVLGTVLAGFQQTYAQWADIAMYALVALVLIFRPQGIFGSVEVEE
ncbi:branched-chain amino acid ABC transporter permease [Halobacteriales archaeon SW_10_68_16]|nr:MAG: branched-chain amino acid ABC transporter permease [Halobacteriales archaeon SW_10_68_16]